MYLCTKFQGSQIQITEILNVKSKASIHGEVITGKLSVEPGAEFSASCIMKTTVKNPPPNEPATEPEEKTE